MHRSAWKVQNKKGIAGEEKVKTAHMGEIIDLEEIGKRASNREETNTNRLLRDSPTKPYFMVYKGFRLLCKCIFICILPIHHFPLLAISK